MYSIETPKTMGKKTDWPRETAYKRRESAKGLVVVVCLFVCFREREVQVLPLPSLSFSSSSARKLVSMASSTLSRWLRPEVYPLFAAVGVAVGICGMQLVRNICSNPEVRVSKENRAAGVLDNFAEGEKYAMHSLRKFVHNKSPEIMPNINGFFTDPK